MTAGKLEKNVRVYLKNKLVSARWHVHTFSLSDSFPMDIYLEKTKYSLLNRCDTLLPIHKLYHIIVENQTNAKPSYKRKAHIPSVERQNWIWEINTRWSSRPHFVVTFQHSLHILLCHPPYNHQWQKAWIRKSNSNSSFYERMGKFWPHHTCMMLICTKEWLTATSSHTEPHRIRTENLDFTQETGIGSQSLFLFYFMRVGVPYRSMHMVFSSNSLQIKHLNPFSIIWNS